MLAQGIGGNVTGSRAELIVCDDVEVAGNCDTPGKREELRERLAECEFILTPGGTILYRRHAALRGQPLRAARGGGRLPRLLPAPASSAAGRRRPQRLAGALPARGRAGAARPGGAAAVPAADDARMRRRRGGVAARSRADHPLRRGPRLPRGEWAADAVPARAAARLRRRLLGPRLWPARARGIAACSPRLLGRGGQPLPAPPGLHHAGPGAATRTPRRSSAASVAALARELLLPVVRVETNGIGKFLPALLRREMARAGAACTVVEHNSHRPKAERILGALDPALAARRLHAHDGGVPHRLPAGDGGVEAGRRRGARRRAGRGGRLSAGGAGPDAGPATGARGARRGAGEQGLVFFGVVQA